MSPPKKNRTFTELTLNIVVVWMNLVTY